MLSTGAPSSVMRWETSGESYGERVSNGPLLRGKETSSTALGGRDVAVAVPSPAGISGSCMLIVKLLPSQRPRPAQAEATFPPKVARAGRGRNRGRRGAPHAAALT